MPKVRHHFISTLPLFCGLYMTCLKSERDASVRWFDGSLWWDIHPQVGRASKRRPFELPTSKKITGGYRFPDWYKGKQLYMRAITNQALVRVGVPYSVYSKDEVLKYMESKGVIPHNWFAKYHKALQAKHAKPALLETDYGV